MIAASLIGTYLDLFFVGNGIYFFPNRPFPTIFNINVAFTLLGLPVITLVTLYFLSSMSKMERRTFIVFLSLIFCFAENISENFGWFKHSESWEHFYSFIGYIIFFSVIWRIYNMFKSGQ
ncbi:hypothetical protein FCL54_22605 [Pseudalkalibacillus caeni]|uniref:Group-specific protein n=2 Tax=Exobacillus caeni TaxID=2574798 RepID=A0A5R9EXZ9_9BACL|nr:hypothetical protein FCL54_22605 [Pseudalkalibacillus caeni]